MPGYIAWVYVYGLSSQLAQADGVFNRWNEEGFRQEYYEKLVSGIDEVVKEVKVEPQPLVETFDPEEDDEEELPEEELTPEAELPAGGETYDPEEELATVAPMKPAKAKRRGRSAT